MSLSSPVYVLKRGAEVNDIVNMTESQWWMRSRSTHKLST